MSIELILVVPGLLAMPGTVLAAAPSLATLAQFGPPPDVELRGGAAALLGALGLPAATPVAPLAALGAGVDAGDDYVLCADPVHLEADRDEVVLLQRVDDLSAADATKLAATLDRHFAGDDLRFVPARPDAWFARREQTPDLVTTPFDAAHRRSLFASLPSGADSGTWKRWQNEIEMLLHEHPVNATRDAQGLPAANGIWFWGGGRLSGVDSLPVVAAVATPGRIGDLARGIAQLGRGTAKPLQQEDNATTSVDRAAAWAKTARASRVFAIAVLPTADGPAAVAALEARWLLPALRRLSRSDFAALKMIADGNGAAATWVARRPTFRQRVLARARRRPFAVPSAPGP